MEPMGAEGQWTSLSGIYTAEEADFMALLLSNSVPHNNQTLPSFWPAGHDLMANMAGNYGGPHCSLELSNSSFCSFSRGNSSTSGDVDSNVFPTSSNDQYCSLSTDHQYSLRKSNSTNSFSLMSFDFGVGDLKASTNSYLDEGDHEDRNEIGNGISEGVAPEKKALPLEEKSSRLPDGNSAKRTWRSENVEVVGKRNAKSKKKQKFSSIKNDDEALLGNAGASNGQSSSSCCSGDDSINCGPQELSAGGDTSSLSPNGRTGSAGNSDVKTRARRGSATDPQSLYARKRRERINERLRILQNLVPNGTKVDISTMLEEAVQYVKFLQLQIKLLSSDELWMYAPIAYNGMDIGLDHLNLAKATKQS